MNQLIQLCPILAAGAMIAASPAFAADAADLDILTRATAQAAPGMDLARRQIRSGDLAGALATLERLIINNPDDAVSRMFHAAVLCRMDDAGGSQVEFDMLQGRDLSEAVWQEAVAPCDAVAARRAGGTR